MEKYRIPIPDIGFHPPVYSCVRARKPFFLDGNIEKPFWDDAPFTELFLDIEGEKKEKPRFLTRVKMMWDEDNFYIGAELLGDEIWASQTERDCVIFQDNDFEIFIDPDSDTHQYFEFEMNALGTVWDLMLTKPYRDFGGTPVNGFDFHGLQCAVHIDGELNNPKAQNRRWMAEVVLPFSALKEGNGGKLPKEGDYYRVNFSRVQWDVKTENGRYEKLDRPEHNWVWSPTGLVNIHYPELWGFVFFTQEGEEHRIPQDERIKWELRRLYYAQHAYYDECGFFASSLSELSAGDDADMVSGLLLETTAHSFEIRCQSADRLRELVIFSDGKTWEYDRITEEGCYDFLCRHMPLSDAADCPKELLYRFIRHAVMVRETVPWGKKLPAELFLNYVLQYRVNNEDVQFDRKQFFDEIYPRIQGMGMKEAALEVNYWCFEKATYRSTDIRTASPLTVIKNSYGRCGEESGLTVAALRSVGIPARQCYTPRWAHCDDNHAWVEAWIDGEWHFLGACEPEPKLDRGWFRLPASRGMLIHSRVAADRVSGETITKRTGQLTEINILSHYANVREVTVQVADAGNRPVSGAAVRFEVVNFSEFYPLAELLTDSRGEVRFVTGLGDLMVTAYKKGELAFQTMDVREADRLVLTLNGRQANDPVSEYRLRPPEGGIQEEKPLTREEEERHSQKMKAAVAVRKAYEDTFFTEEEPPETLLAQAQAHSLTADVLSLLKESRGNHGEICAFLEDEETKELIRWKVKLLKTVTPKDLTDLTAPVLKDHLLGALAYSKEPDQELFCEAVLCPRIWIEPIRPYRSAIQSFFGEKGLARFCEDPQLLVNWIREQIEIVEESGYANLSASPEGLLRYKKGNAMSAKILLVAVLRTGGVPAKLDQVDLSCMYNQDGQWKHLYPVTKNKEAERDATLLLVNGGREALEYHKSFTVSCCQEEGCYRTLDFQGSSWDGGVLAFQVPAGPCRVVTSAREPDGTNVVRIYGVTAEAGKETSVEIAASAALAAEKEVPLKDVVYETPEGEKRRLADDLADGNGIVAWLSVGSEPTEHLLNEFMEAEKEYGRRMHSVVLVVRKPEDLDQPTLKKAVSRLPFLRMRIGYEEDELSEIYEGFAIRDKRLPLVIAVKGGAGRLAFAGYQVGIGEMLLKYMA